LGACPSYRYRLVVILDLTRDLEWKYHVSTWMISNYIRNDHQSFDLLAADHETLPEQWMCAREAKHNTGQRNVRGHDISSTKGWADRPLEVYGARLK
jgi:hypothetical protein